MTPTPTPTLPIAPRARDLESWVPGAVLVAFGTVLLAVQLLGLQGDIVVLLIGLGFAVGYAATRTYGLLIPAGILTGLGSGILLENYYPSMAEPVVLGLALGFLSIYVVDALVVGAKGAGRWWPLIPGGILAAVAVAEGAFGAQGAAFIESWWPTALIIIGVVLLLRRSMTTRTG